jgi:hypothetical protein
VVASQVVQDLVGQVLLPPPQGNPIFLPEVFELPAFFCNFAPVFEA